MADECGQRDGVMTNADEQLASIGFAGTRPDPACWRAARLGKPVPPTGRSDAAAELQCSRRLLRWRALLASRPVSPAYRISRADG